MNICCIYYLFNQLWGLFNLQQGIVIVQNQFYFCSNFDVCVLVMLHWVEEISWEIVCYHNIENTILNVPTTQINPMYFWRSIIWILCVGHFYKILLGSINMETVLLLHSQPTTTCSLLQTKYSKILAFYVLYYNTSWCSDFVWTLKYITK